MPSFRAPFTLLAAIALLVAGCAKQEDEAANAQALVNAPAAATPASTPSAAPTTAAANGFDVAAAPVGTAPPGAFPYFGLLDGYHAVTREEAGEFTRGNQRDVNFDRYEFFDGTKLIIVEGRLRTIQAIGTGRSFFEAQKNYERLIRDLGGVTVWEGSGARLKELKINYAEPRHRSRFTMDNYEKFGVYMLRTPTSEIWVEVAQIYDEKPDNYYLTVVERKALDVSARLLPAAEMKRALDTAGRVSLYVNFDTDKTVVLPASQPLLAEVVKLLQADPALKLTIEGHTDNAGTPQHNQTLSQGRANAVMGTLIAAGIDPARLQAKGLGQTKPIADNGAEDGRAKNRRVELVRR